MARIAREFVRTAFLGRSSSVYVANSVMAALLVPFAVGLVTLVRQRAREVLPALLFAALYVAVFLLSGSTTATGYPWYFVPPALVVALVAGAGTMWLMDALRSRPPLPRRGLAARALALTPALLWAVLMMPTVALDLGQVRQLAAVREQPFAAASRWLSRRLPARAVIASNEIGAAGWYARPDVYVLDLHGLSLPRAQRSLTRVQLIQHYRPQAILMRDVFGPHFAGVIDAPGYRWTSLRSLAIGVREDLADSLLAHEDELPVELGRVRRGL